MSATSSNQTHDAGNFSAWLESTEQTLKDGHPAEVPCGDCDACCRASQFIHVAAHEEAVGKIPKQLLFPAPENSQSNTTFILGHDSQGHCPMLAVSGCNIYDSRPSACRTYDCRIFAASGYYSEEPAQAEVANKSKQWRFSYDGDDALQTHQAVKRAAEYLSKTRVTSGNAIQISLSALKVHRLFLDPLNMPTENDVKGLLNQ